MHKKGFTLVELLAIIVILAILGTVAMITVNYITDKGKTGVYENYEKTLSGSAELYLLENTEKIPSVNGNTRVTYDTLTTELFMDKVKDPKGGSCQSSYVYIERGVDVSNNYNLTYHACLICKNADDSINYKSEYDDFTC